MCKMNRIDCPLLLNKGRTTEWTVRREKHDLDGLIVLLFLEKAIKTHHSIGRKEN